MILAAAALAIAVADITLGEPANAFIARAGDPLITHSAEYNGDTAQELLFFAPTGKAVEYVRVIHGNIVAVRLVPAPSLDLPGPMPSVHGAALGDPESRVDAAFLELRHHDVKTPRGVMRLYRIDGVLYQLFFDGAHALKEIDVALPENQVASLPRAADPTVHSGTSPENAIVIQAPNEAVGNQKIGVFLTANTCGGDGYWKPIEYGTPTAYNARPMAKVDAACTAGGIKQTFYFDIKSFFGHASQ